MRIVRRIHQEDGKCLTNTRYKGYYVSQMAVGNGNDGRKGQSGMFTKSFYFYYFTVDCRFAS